jgi:hypothetical protein
MCLLFDILAKKAKVNEIWSDILDILFSLNNKSMSVYNPKIELVNLTRMTYEIMQMRLMNFNLLSSTKSVARRALISNIISKIIREIYYKKNFTKNRMNQGSQQITTVYLLLHRSHSTQVQSSYQFRVQTIFLFIF